jgi:hypothetical protein
VGGANRDNGNREIPKCDFPTGARTAGPTEGSTVDTWPVTRRSWVKHLNPVERH